MRKITSICSAALLAAVVVGTWAMSTKANSPVATPAAMSPFDMMVSAPDLPVHVIVDAV